MRLRGVPLLIALAFAPPLAHAQEVDLLFVVDNSGSMAEKQARLAAGLDRFLGPLLASPADFHLGVVSTDMANPFESGRLLARPGNPTILTRQTPNLQTVFAENVQLGTMGDGFEKGLQAMEAALSSPLVGGDNRGFLRPGAPLAVVFVSDEEDCSHDPGVIPEFDGDECVRNVSLMIPVAHYADFLTRLVAGDPSRVVAAAVVGPDIPRPAPPPPPPGCVDDSNCPLGQRCLAGVCQVPPPPPSVCTADRECPSGRCADGRCCPPDPTLLACLADADCARFAPGTSCTGQKCLPLPGETARPYAPRACSCFTPEAGSAEPGTRYIDLVRAFGRNGFYASICDPDWGGTLEMLARLVVARTLLPGPPPPPPPPILADAGGPYFGFEGSPIAFHGSASSPVGAPLQFLWDFGDGGTATRLDPVHTYADDGSFRCQLTVTDGVQSTRSVCQVEVQNVIPVVAPLPGATLLEGETYAAEGSFTDPGADRWAANVDYGDGYGVERLALAQKTFQLRHLYFTAGTYTVRVSVSDDDSRTPGIAEATIVVLTPRQMIQALSAFIDGLVASGALDPGNANSLEVKLQAALQQLDRRNLGAATNQLEAFLHEVDALEKVGRLAPGDARRLADDVGRILRRIHHVDPPPVCACPAAPIEAHVLETVTLSGAVCSDPEGEPLRFAWTVEQRPAGSTSPLTGADSPEASLFLDLATTPQTPYVVRVTATDPAGLSASCAYTILAAPPGPSPTGTACQILTPPSPLRQGQTLVFAAVAKNLNGAIIPRQSFSWRSDNTSAVTIDRSGVATGGSTAGVANITCRVVGGLAADSAPVAVHNYANAEAGMVRAVVVDARTGAPLPGASVLFEPLGTIVTTDPNGVAQVAATGAVDVHVFHAGYTWVSIVRTVANDLLVPLSPTPDDTRAGGFKGGLDFSLGPNPSDTVGFGFAGASLPGSFIDLDLGRVIGEGYRVQLQIGGTVTSVVVPSGLVLTLGDNPIKGEFTAVAEPGLRHAWAIGGKIPFDQLVAVLAPILGGGGSEVPFGQIIAQLLPFFGNFLHFVKTDVAVTEVPKVPDAGDINGNGSTTDLVPDFANPTGFPTVTARVNQPLTLATSLAVPALPRYGNAFLDGVVVIAGANVTGRGLVPLGLGAAVDAPLAGETPDGLIDVDPLTPGNQSTLTFRMSPLHDGLEGSPFVFATLALTLRAGAPPSVSGIITHTDRVDPITPLGATSFLGFPEAASFNLTTRTFDLGTPVAGGIVYRADFKGPDGGWIVYFKAPRAGAPAFVLPTPPFGTDRAVLFCPGDSGTQPCTSLRVLTLATARSGASAPTLDDISAFGTVNLNRLNDFLSAFSSEGCQKSGDCAPPATP